MPVSSVVSKSNSADVIVIGAGLAGSACARALAERGLDVVVCEKEPAIAQAASGNPAGIMIPHLTRTLLPSTQFYLHAWQTALDNPHLQGCRIGHRGAIHLAFNQDLKDRFQLALRDYCPEGIARYLSGAELSELAGCEIAHEGLYYPEGGMVSPRALCQRQLEHKQIRLQLDCEIKQAQYLGDEKIWVAHNQNQKTIQAPYLVLAQSNQARSLDISSWLPIYPVRGQILIMPPDHGFTQITRPINYDGYISPVLPDGHQIIGASFEHWNSSPVVDGEQQQWLYDLGAQKLPLLQRAALPVKKLPGRVSFRCSSPDRFVIAGALPDYLSLQQELKSNPSRAQDWIQNWPRDRNLPNVYVSLAHGSRGILSSLFVANWIASLIADGQASDHASLRQGPNPCLTACLAERYLRRSLKRWGSLAQRIPQAVNSHGSETKQD